MFSAYVRCVEVELRSADLCAGIPEFGTNLGCQPVYPVGCTGAQTDIAGGQPLSTWCITSTSCSLQGVQTPDLSFTIGAGCPTCTFKFATRGAGGSGCTPAGSACVCPTAAISGYGKTATFADTTLSFGNEWIEWWFVIQC
jgi:hypothetical protein